jgi:hypothetical protein
MKRVAIVFAVVAGLSLCSVAFAAGALSGTYKTRVGGSTWTIAFKNGGYTVYQGGRAFIFGKDTIRGTKISFTDVSGAGKCSGTGTYRFTVSGRKLTFDKISDTHDCVGREAVLSGRFAKVS